MQAYLQAFPEQTSFEPVFRAYVKAWKGEPVQTPSSLLETSGSTGQPVLASSRMLEFATEIACGARDLELGKVVYENLLAYRGRPHMVTGIGFALYGVTDDTLLRLASLLGRLDEADRHAEDGLAFCERLGALPIAARIRCHWAESLAGRGGAEVRSRALALAEQALRAAEGLGMTFRAERCRRLMERLAGAPGTETPAMGGRPLAEPAVRLHQEGEYWTLTGLGDVCRIRDGRGMRMLAELVRSPKREIHALELSGSRDAVDAGDAGEALDHAARAAYAARARDLGQELAEAQEWNDAGRRGRLEAELEALEQELARAVGLGGRERRVGSAVERARINVRRRLSVVLQKIREASPALGSHFESALRTGTYSAYDPDRAR
jgi:hypothetical protein